MYVNYNNGEDLTTLTYTQPHYCLFETINVNIYYITECLCLCNAYSMTVCWSFINFFLSLDQISHKCSFFYEFCRQKTVFSRSSDTCKRKRWWMNKRMNESTEEGNWNNNHDNHSTVWNVVECFVVSPQ